MAKRRKSAPVVAQPPAAPPTQNVNTVPRRLLDTVAIVAAMLCVALGYLSRKAINPDGVSYLDLSAALLRGDLPHFVQGYWSPLLSIAVAALAAIAGWRGATLVILAHWINTAVSLGGLYIIWRWARNHGDANTSGDGRVAGFGIGALAAYMLVSAGMPRIEAVTPDVLLLTAAIWIAYEACVHRGRRWLLLGVLFGVAFLAKTSSWPWLLLALPLLAWAAVDRTARVRLGWSTLACGVLVLAWTVPMSLRYGHLTVGSTGRLNYSWYIEKNTSRLPDIDRGSNTAYHPIPVAGAEPLTLAVFDDATDWTYQPWGDPTAWRDKVTGGIDTPLAVDEIVMYWLRGGALVFGFWMLPAILGVMAPAVLLQWRPQMSRELITEQRFPLAMMLLGLAGLLQFTLVHAEPRLLAPFGMMLALGTLSWCYAAPARTSLVRWHVARLLLLWVGIGAAVGFAIPKFTEAFQNTARLQRATTQLDAVKAQAAQTGLSIDRIAIVGPAAPVLGVAYWIGAHIAEQMPPESADRLSAMSPTQQAVILQRVFGGRIPMVWRTDATGGMRMLIVPPPQPAAPATP